VLGVFYDLAASTLALVDPNGTLVASVTAERPHRNSEGLPWISNSRDTAYYLESGGEVHFLRPDGTSGQVTTVDLRPGEDAGIAVSPDDSRISVAVLSYALDSPAPAYLGMRMYVEDLIGGGHHVDIYSSSINAEFPIGWTHGRLIVALSTPFCCQSSPLNPYGAVEYHVVDPANGNRLATLCRGLGPWGPPTTIGTTCRVPGPPPFDWRGWDGSSCCAPGTPVGPLMSPDGTQTAGAPGGYIEISGPQSDFVVTQIAGDPEGWLDVTHIVYRLRSDSTLHILGLPFFDRTPLVPMNGLTTTFQGEVPGLIS
jgi:hypothetical protein